ncbi:MAG: acetate kinase [Candidatus Omnitrophota bacterium]
MKILVINSGSSSIKYKFFKMPEEKLIDSGIVDRIGEKRSLVSDHQQGLGIILNKVKDVDAVGHRVVHGGEKFKKPVLINNEVIKKIKECLLLAPLHNPANLSGIYACKKLLKNIPQVAIFDTAFYQTLPAYAYFYGLDYKFYKKYGIRRYGFHGTSHEFVALKAARILKKPLNKLRLITCHLGNGCSISAIKFAKAIDTSMGFTPLEGLLMGTRCGDLDPAVVTFLAHRIKSISKIEEILNKKSGLLGLSGISNDMRQVESSMKKGNQRAKLAIEVFVYRIRKYIGAYAAILGGLDALIFTAGVGENQIEIRKKVTKDLFSNFLKKPKVLVIRTNEELMIAKQTYKLVKDLKSKV